MKKKALSLILMAAMTVTAITGCGSTGSAPASKEETTTGQSTETEAETEAASDRKSVV